MKRTAKSNRNGHPNPNHNPIPNIELQIKIKIQVQITFNIVTHKYEVHNDIKIKLDFQIEIKSPNQHVMNITFKICISI